MCGADFHASGVLTPLLLALSQAHPWAPATIFVDELDARLFQGAAHRHVVRYRHRRFSLDELSPPDRRHPYSRCASQRLRRANEQALGQRGFGRQSKLSFMLTVQIPADISLITRSGADRCPRAPSNVIFRRGESQWIPKCGKAPKTAAPSSAALTPGSSWARRGGLLRLWREKRGEVEPEDLSGNLIVQLGLATEELNRRWYEANTGQVITDVQRQVRHPALRWMAATLDGRVEATGAVFEAKFMLPWSFSEEAAAEKYMAQLQHNMWVVASRAAVLSVITGGGKWVEITTHADPLYQHLIVTAERKFWRCVESGEPPRLFGVEPPKPRIQAVRIVDMSGSNAWAEFAGIFARTRAAHLEHEQAKTELKSLMPEDAKEAIGHGVRAKRSKSGAVSFDLLVREGSPHAAVE